MGSSNIEVASDSCPPSQRNDLVFGAAVGYTIKQIEPFLKSLRLSGYTGETILLVDKKLATAINNSRFSDVVKTRVVPEWIPFRYKLYRGRRTYLLYLWYPYHSLLWVMLQILKRASTNRPVWQLLLKVADQLMAPIESRFLHALTVVRSGRYRRILLTDVRDVLFQSDPFAGLPDKGLCLGIETYPDCLQQEPHNERWIKMAYGQKMLSKIGKKPISCAGVTLGDQYSMINYLEKMSNELLNLKFKATKSTMLISLDQAAHNKLLWMGEIEDYHLLRTGHCASLATLSDERDFTNSIKIDDKNRLLNMDGKIISILHMYDRWPEVKKTVLAQLK